MNLRILNFVFVHYELFYEIIITNRDFCNLIISFSKFKKKNRYFITTMDAFISCKQGIRVKWIFNKTFKDLSRQRSDNWKKRRKWSVSLLRALNTLYMTLNKSEVYLSMFESPVKEERRNDWATNKHFRKCISVF